MDTFYLSGEPCVLGLAYIQTFPPAPQPCIRVDTPLMRGNDQHLSFKTDTLSLGSLVSGVEVGSICADELRDIIDYLSSLGSEELIYVGIGFNVH